VRAGAAGIGLVAGGLGAETPTRAEAQKNMEQQKDPDQCATLPIAVNEAAGQRPAKALKPKTWPNSGF
jgi:hypothetical protein